MANSTLALVYARLAVRAKSDSNSYIQSAFVHIEIIRESRFASKSILSMALAAEGYIKMTLNDLDGSENCFVQSIKMDAGNISGLLGLADIYVKKGNKEKALSVYKEAEFASPSSNYASYKLGNIYRDFGDTENAILAYKRSDNFALAHLELGKIYLSQDEYNDALSAFRFAASKNKKLSDVWANIAWTICEMNPDDHTIIKEAEESARRALLLEENTSNLWHRHAILSRSLYLQNKLDKSLVEVKKAISLAPNQSQAYYYLALIEKELGKFDKVHIAIQKIIELDKKDEWQIKAEALLDQLP
jgi:tetratricopeptide (TPR) repeat protein